MEKSGTTETMIRNVLIKLWFMYAWRNSNLGDTSKQQCCNCDTDQIGRCEIDTPYMSVWSRTQVCALGRARMPSM